MKLRLAKSIPPSGHVESPSWKLALGAVGVVYGDIGTSPLYAMKECFHGSHAVEPSLSNILGVLSLFFWSLTLVIVVKYLTFIMTADNEGEGGVLALLALIRRRRLAADSPRMWRGLLIFAGLFGAALLYGDGVITPAISVLSAVEGLEVATPFVRPYVVPITVVILIGLFLMQKHGTARVGTFFGPIMLIWFTVLGVTGARWIAQEPQVLLAIDPRFAMYFFVENGTTAWLILSSVVLCVTGGEALYADMGHFGRGPIRIAWYLFVFPALLLNYFGQGALLIHQPTHSVENPFFATVSGIWLYPLVGLATLATVIASQALISGAFSLTRQAIQLGYLPRMTIVHTSGETEGQIYVPEVNTALMFTCVAIVLNFGESSALAAAYGIAVTGTMAVTSVLFFEFIRQRWNPWLAWLLLIVFLSIDLSFFSANLAKIQHGGWLPIAIASVLFVCMTTWKRGRADLGAAIRKTIEPFEKFAEEIKEDSPPRVRGTAVFMTANREGVPPVLLHHYKHNRVLHEQVVFLTLANERVPYVRPKDRVQVTRLGNGFFHVAAHYGFMQTPNVPSMLSSCAIEGLVLHASETSYFLGRQSLITKGRSRMSQWRKTLFSFLSRNSLAPTTYFDIPPNRVIEIGIQVEL